MRIAVTGGRDFDSWHLVVHALRQMPEDAVLVHGAARGADSLCAEWWTMQGRECDPHPAVWDLCGEGCPNAKHRKRRRNGSEYCPFAGFRRNQAMAESGIDLLIAFPGGNGTDDMTRRCEDAGIPVLKAVPDATV